MIDYIKSVYKNRKTLVSMIKNDFVNRFANTSLGVVWGFISPIIMILLYIVVFEYILNLQSSGPDPYIVWFIPGTAIWMFLNEAIPLATNSIREYSYLVKKIAFPVDIIPLIKIFSGFIVTIVIILIVVIICMIMGYLPNVLLLLYYTFAALMFAIAFTRLTSALAVMLGDVSQIVSVFMQLMFWATPIVWNINTVAPMLQHILKFNPFTYLVCGFRDIFISGNILGDANFIYTIVFWVITIAVLIYGNIVFNRNKNEFSDVL